MFDYVSVGDRIVALTGDELVLLSSDFYVVSKATFPMVNCKNMVYRDGVGIVLFCTSNTGSDQ